MSFGDTGGAFDAITDDLFATAPAQAIPDASPWNDEHDPWSVGTNALADAATGQPSTVLGNAVAAYADARREGAKESEANDAHDDVIRQGMTTYGGEPVDTPEVQVADDGSYTLTTDGESEHFEFGTGPLGEQQLAEVGAQGDQLLEAGAAIAHSIEEFGGDENAYWAAFYEADPQGAQEAYDLYQAAGGLLQEVQQAQTVDGATEQATNVLTGVYENLVQSHGRGVAEAFAQIITENPPESIDDVYAAEMRATLIAQDPGGAIVDEANATEAGEMASYLAECAQYGLDGNDPDVADAVYRADGDIALAANWLSAA